MRLRRRLRRVLLRFLRLLLLLRGGLHRVRVVLRWILLVLGRVWLLMRLIWCCHLSGRGKSWRLLRVMRVL